MKPIKFRFLRGELDAITNNNLKILATIFCYLVRLVNDNTNRLMVIFKNLKFLDLDK